MRFMMLMYPGAQAEQPGTMPTPEMIEAMMKYNEELVRAGVLLAGDGLHPSTKGARITFPQGQPVVLDGPFTEAKELIGGYWMLQVKSKAEAVEWARRCPAGADQMLELRQVFEPEDFGPEVAEAENALLKRIEEQNAGK